MDEELDREQICDILRELSRKLFIIEVERKSSKRKEIIDSILLGDESEMKQLKLLLGI